MLQIELLRQKLPGNRVILSPSHLDHIVQTYARFYNCVSYCFTRLCGCQSKSKLVIDRSRARLMGWVAATEPGDAAAGVRQIGMLEQPGAVAQGVDSPDIAVFGRPPHRLGTDADMGGGILQSHPAFGSLSLGVVPRDAMVAA